MLLSTITAGSATRSSRGVSGQDNKTVRLAGGGSCVFGGGTTRQ